MLLVKQKLIGIAMKNIGCSGAKVIPNDVIYFGVRDTEEPEDRQIASIRY